MSKDSAIKQISPTVFKIGSDIIDLSRVDHITAIGEGDSVDGDKLYFFEVVYYPGPYGYQRIKGKDLDRLNEARKFLRSIKEKIDLVFFTTLTKFFNKQKGVYWDNPASAARDFLRDHKL